ncbi:hypothetical protein ACM3CZ_10035 [Edwardsiella ictaluri]
MGDLFSWSAIGARTTESQTHREMASGLSMPVGFKNGTDGSMETAINAMKAAAMPHRFVGINQAGQVCLLPDAGKPRRPCYSAWGANAKTAAWHRMSRSARRRWYRPVCARCWMVDCSHGNSCKDYRRQPQVAQSVITRSE